MKFMKLGTKLDTFQTDENNVRVVATEYATDFTVNVGDVKFYVHKFPLMSRCYRLQKLYSNSDEIHISDIPGGPAAFEICAKFCYGMTVSVNAYNVVAARCAAGYLEMYQTIDTGNLISKIDAFLDTSIFRSWKDSIIVLQSTKSLLPWSDDLKLVSHCIDSIASKVSIDPSKVDWSYAYDRKKLPSESSLDLQWSGVRKPQLVPKDWWVEDLCELEIDLYKRVITVIKAKGRVSAEVIGEALRSYTYKRLPGFRKGSMKHGGDVMKTQALLETVVWLLPEDKGSISCSFLLKAYRASNLLNCVEMCKKELVKKIGRQLDIASVSDLLIPGFTGDDTVHDIDTVLSIVEEFVMQASSDASLFVSANSKTSVTKLVDGYLAEIAKDPNLPLSKFVALAEMVSGNSRPVHDGIYCAIDMYLKVHPGMSKSERTRICGLMDCGRLSAECRAHAVQNELLPTRVLIQILFFEQVRLSAASSSISSGSSHLTATAIAEGDCNMVPTAEDLKSVKLAGGSGGSGQSTTSSCNSDGNQSGDDRGNGKVKGILAPKSMLSKLWSSKAHGGENGNSDTSNSLSMTNPQEPNSMSLQHSVL